MCHIKSVTSKIDGSLCFKLEVMSDKNPQTIEVIPNIFFWVRTPPFNLSKGFGTHKFQRGEKNGLILNQFIEPEESRKKILFFNAWHNASKVTILSKN